MTNLNPNYSLRATLGAKPPFEFRFAYDANPSEFRISEISQRGLQPSLVPVALRALPPPPLRSGQGKLLMTLTKGRATEIDLEQLVEKALTSTSHTGRSTSECSVICFVRIFHGRISSWTSTPHFRRCRGNLRSTSMSWPARSLTSNLLVKLESMP